MNQAHLPTDVSIITTYRCCMQCKMCNIWENPSDIKKEIKAKDLERLPHFKFINITGGEPFVRNDIEDIIEVAFTKSPRVVISTAGYHVDDILALAEKFPRIGIRVSLEGLSTINDYLRGRAGGFDRGLQTLLGLMQMGVKDIGIATTVSHNNCHELLSLHQLTRGMGMDFATATFHNSFYFHKKDNFIKNNDEVAEAFFDLSEALLKSYNPKDWFRAFFNVGLINYTYGNKRLLPCEAGTVNFFIEPYGDVYPCNGLEERYWKESMGNIKDFDTFEALWHGKQAQQVREKVRTCPKNCWMVGTAAPVMKKYLWHPLKWVISHKLKSMAGQRLDRGRLPRQFNVGQSPRQGDLRGGPLFAATPQDRFPMDTGTRMMTRVMEVKSLTPAVYRIRLERGNFTFKPGQYVSVGPHLRYAQNRDYTFCSPPGDPCIEFLIKEIPKGEISPFLSRLTPGDLVDLVGPYGNFSIRDLPGKKHIFIATGVGIGPFLSFIRTWPELDYQLIHGLRTEKDLILASDVPKDRYTSCISRETGGDFRGRVTDLIKAHTPEPDALYYLCGNPYMLNQMQQILREKGVPGTDILKEPYYTY